MRYLYMQWTMDDDGVTADFESASIINHDDPKNVKIFNNRDDVWDYIKEEPSYVYVINVECVKYLFKSYVSKKEWTKELKGIVYNVYKRIDKNHSELEIQFRDFTKLENRDCDIFEMQKVISHHAEMVGRIGLVPITISIYNRKSMRKAARSDRKYMRKFKASKLNVSNYVLTSACFHGGWCGLNPLYKNCTIRKVYHDDFRSHYPTQLRKHKFPLGKPFKTHDSLEKIIMQNEDYTYFVKISMEDFRPRDNVICMVKSEWFKKQRIRGKMRYVLELTNLDLKWFIKHYHYKNLIIENQICFKNFELPKCLIDEIDKAFIEKYKAKVEKELHKNTPEQEWYEFLYQQAKIRLNGLYGEFAKDPLKYMPGDMKEMLQKYYSSRYNFIIYPVGVMVTAYARDELFEFIELIGYNNVIYGDTDSLFYVTDEAHERVKIKNAKLKETAPYAEYEGKRFYYDEFEPEEVIDFFKALHSKCYAWVKDGVFHSKIAGIPDKVNGITRDQEIGNMFNFRVGMTFKHCTPTIIQECPGGYKLIKLKEIVLGDEKEHARLLKLLAYKEA